MVRLDRTSWLGIEDQSDNTKQAWAFRAGRFACRHFKSAQAYLQIVISVYDVGKKPNGSKLGANRNCHLTFPPKSVTNPMEQLPNCVIPFPEPFLEN